MTAQPQHKWTATTFLEWSANHPGGRFELEGGRLIEMAAEQAKHALTKHAAVKALEEGVRVAGLDCTAFPAGMTVVVDDEHVRLPDAALQCGPVDLETTILNNPVVLVEVLSPSSGNRDENHKLVEYFSLPSVHHYLLISPDRRVVVHFRRTAHPDEIDTRIMHGGTIELTPPGLTVSVEDLLGKATA